MKCAASDEVAFQPTAVPIPTAAGSGIDRSTVLIHTKLEWWAGWVSINLIGGTFHESNAETFHSGAQGPNGSPSRGGQGAGLFAFFEELFACNRGLRESQC